MRRLLLVSILLLLSPLALKAQGGTTFISGQVLDSLGNAYVNSQVNISFFDPGTSGKLPLLNGSTFQTQYTVQTDSFGNLPNIVLTALPDNGTIATSSGATGTQWIFRVVYQDRVTSFSVNLTINCALNLPATCTGNTINVTAALQAAAASLPGAVFPSISVTSLTSRSASPAQSGVIRLANTDAVNWRNAANSGDLSLRKDAFDLLVLTDFSSIRSNAYQSGSLNPPLSGLFRLATNETVTWRNQSNTGDLPLGLVTPAGNIPGNTFTLGNQGLSASFFSDTTQVSATGGLIRLSSGNSINWRNGANVSDIVIQKTNGDSLDISGFRGVFMPQTTFASINNPAPTNGLFYYCSDCTIANPCAGGGTGALAKRLAGVWVCN